MNKTIQDLIMELETTKKSQRDTTLEIENLGKNSRVLDTSISNRLEELDEGISDAEDTIESIDSTIKENAKCRNRVTQNMQEIQTTMRRPNLRTTGIEEHKDLQLN